MNSLKCDSCGAPLNPTPAELEKGVAACAYCHSVNRFEPTAPARDSNRPRQADESAATTKLPRWDAPASRPADTRIELVNEPGGRFEARLPHSRFHHETILAEKGIFIYRQQFFVSRRTEKFRWDEIEGFQLTPILLAQNRSLFHLYLDLGSRKIRLAERATGEEIRWLYTELKAFFESIKKSKLD